MNCNRQPIPCPDGDKAGLPQWVKYVDVQWGRYYKRGSDKIYTDERDCSEYFCWVIPYGEMLFGEPTIKREYPTDDEPVQPPSYPDEEPPPLPTLVCPSYVLVKIMSSSVALQPVFASGTPLPDRVRLIVSTAPDFSEGTIVYDNQFDQITWWYVDDLEPDTRYYYKMELRRQLDSLECTSPEWTFKTLPRPPIAPAVAPVVEYKLINGVYLQLAWLIVGGAEWYEVDIATDPDFENLISPYDKYKCAIPFLLTEALPENTTVYIRVRGCNVVGDGPWSDTVIVTTSYGIPRKLGSAHLSSMGCWIKIDFEFDTTGPNATHAKFKAEGLEEVSASTSPAYLGPVSPNTEYYIYGCACNEHGCSQWEYIGYVKTGSAIPPPGTSTIETAPTLSIKYVAGYAQFDVNPQPNPAYGVEFEFGPNPDFEMASIGVLSPDEYRGGCNYKIVSCDPSWSVVYARARYFCYYQGQLVYGPWSDAVSASLTITPAEIEVVDLVYVIQSPTDIDVYVYTTVPNCNTIAMYLDFEYDNNSYTYAWPDDMERLYVKEEDQYRYIFVLDYGDIDWPTNSVIRVRARYNVGGQEVVGPWREYNTMGPMPVISEMNSPDDNTITVTFAEEGASMADIKTSQWVATGYVYNKTLTLTGELINPYQVYQPVEARWMNESGQFSPKVRHQQVFYPGIRPPIIEIIEVTSASIRGKVKLPSAIQSIQVQFRVTCASQQLTGTGLEFEFGFSNLSAATEYTITAEVTWPDGRTTTSQTTVQTGSGHSLRNGLLGYIYVDLTDLTCKDDVNQSYTLPWGRFDYDIGHIHLYNPEEHWGLFPYVKKFFDFPPLISEQWEHDPSIWMSWNHGFLWPIDPRADDIWLPARSIALRFGLHDDVWYSVPIEYVDAQQTVFYRSDLSGDYAYGSAYVGVPGVWWLGVERVRLRTYNQQGLYITEVAGTAVFEVYYLDENDQLRVARIESPTIGVGMNGSPYHTTFGVEWYGSDGSYYRRNYPSTVIGVIEENYENVPNRLRIEVVAYGVYGPIQTFAIPRRWIVIDNARLLTQQPNIDKPLFNYASVGLKTYEYLPDQNDFVTIPRELAVNVVSVGLWNRPLAWPHEYAGIFSGYYNIVW